MLKSKQLLNLRITEAWRLLTEFARRKSIQIFLHLDKRHEICVIDIRNGCDYSWVCLSFVEIVFPVQTAIR